MEKEYNNESVPDEIKSGTDNNTEIKKKRDNWKIEEFVMDYEDI